MLRLHNNAVFTPLESPRVLSEADRQAGVVEDVKIRLGSDFDAPEGRLVRVEADGHTFLLFTNLQDLTAELIALIYRYRWQIELFFKWIKCVLGCSTLDGRVHPRHDPPDLLRAHRVGYCWSCGPVASPPSASGKRCNSTGSAG